MSNNTPTASNTARPIPYAKIVYEPSSVYRMRYEAENRNTYLFAENENMNNDQSLATSFETKLKNIGRKKNQNTDGLYPRVQIVNGQGPATLIVSCVNKSEPYHVHPHKLVGEYCKSGVAVLNISKGETHFDLAGVSIQFTKKSDIEKSIQELKSKNVDPFNAGFNFDKNLIDLSQLRLCFQIYLRDSLESSEIIRDPYHILKPVVSQIISNTSRKTTLSIIESFNMSSSCDGGSTIILLIKKLEKEQKPLKAKFYDSNGWFSIVDIKEKNIHYQSTLHFPAPAYKKIEKDVTVFLKLFVPFNNQNEKEKYTKQLREEDEDENLDSNNNTSSPTTSNHSTQLDGKYESKQYEFVYKPSICDLNLSQIQKRKITDDFFGFSEQPDREAVSEISAYSRKVLHNRQMNLIKEITQNSDYTNIPVFIEDSQIIDPPLINNIITHKTGQEIFLNNQDTLITKNPTLDTANNKFLITENEIQNFVENINVPQTKSPEYDLENYIFTFLDSNNF